MSSESDLVLTIFRELVGDRANKLSGSHYPADINSQITDALSNASDSEDKLLQNDSIGFHLVDWQRDAAFIVALILYPERFSKEVIREEIDRFLLHVPAHVLEAARLAGYSTENIFLDGSKTEQDAAANP